MLKKSTSEFSEEELHKGSNKSQLSEQITEKKKKISLLLNHSLMYSFNTDRLHVIEHLKIQLNRIKI